MGIGVCKKYLRLNFFYTKNILDQLFSYRELQIRKTGNNGRRNSIYHGSRFFYNHTFTV